MEYKIRCNCKENSYTKRKRRKNKSKRRGMDDSRVRVIRIGSDVWWHLRAWVATFLSLWPPCGTHTPCR